MSDPPRKTDKARIVCRLQGQEIIREISTDGLERRLVDLELTTDNPDKAILLRGTADGISFMTRNAVGWLAAGRHDDVVLVCLWAILHDPTGRGWEALDHVGGWVFRMEAIPNLGWCVETFPM